METDNIRHLPIPQHMTGEQRQHWHEQAAYWAVVEEDTQTKLDYAQRQRNNCLRMLGMIGAEGGLSDGA